MVSYSIYSEAEFFEIAKVNVTCTKDARLSMKDFWENQGTLVYYESRAGIPW